MKKITASAKISESHAKYLKYASYYAAYRERNRKKLRTKCRNYYHENKESVLERQRKLYLERPDLLKKKKAEYYQRNKERAAAYNKRREMMIKNGTWESRKNKRETPWLTNKRTV